MNTWTTYSANFSAPPFLKTIGNDTLAQVLQKVSSLTINLTFKGNGAAKQGLDNVRLTPEPSASSRGSAVDCRC